MRHPPTNHDSRLRQGSAGIAALAVLLGTLPAAAQETKPEERTTLGLDPTLSLDPTLPQVGALPGGMAPAFGRPSENQGDWRFDFHGMLTAPLRAGINTRDNPSAGQSRRVLHAPPIVPDDLETFSHTGVVPTPYAQLNFSYGNSVVTGNVSIVAKQPNVATGYFDAPSQLGVDDTFLRILPDLGEKLRLQVLVGAFTSRYGIMGEYDEGRYGTPLVARVNGAGEVVSGTFRLGDFTLLLEQGIQGSTNKAPAEITPEGWNDFADPSVGTSFVTHLHAGVGYDGWVTVGGHYISAWSKDDRGSGTLFPDGSIRVLAADARLTMGRFGHLYLAVGQTDADHARTVGRVIEVLNTRGGPGLMDNYLGSESEGTGRLFTMGAQYDLSLGRLVSYPVPFRGDGPDIFMSVFGMYAKVWSKDDRFDHVGKLKYGGEATYSLLSWLAASARYDRVLPDTDHDRRTFSIISPRIIFRSDWESTDQVVLQYSHWFNGSLVTVRSGYPPQEDVTVIPDEDMVSLSASMWW
jgi:hypothetical protein